MSVPLVTHTPLYSRFMTRFESIRGKFDHINKKDKNLSEKLKMSMGRSEYINEFVLRKSKILDRKNIGVKERIKKFYGDISRHSKHLSRCFSLKEEPLGEVLEVIGNLGKEYGLKRIRLYL